MPIFDYINTYRHEVAAFFANSTATTQATALNIVSTKLLHYLRISNPVNPEVLTAYQHRLESNRANPYMAPPGLHRSCRAACRCSAATCARATRSPPSARRFPLALQRF